MDKDSIKKGQTAHDVCLSLLILLRKFGFSKGMLEDAKQLVFLKYAASLMSGLLSNPYPQYPVPPPMGTWKDKLIAVFSIITLVAVAAALLAGVWKCLLLLCLY